MASVNNLPDLRVGDRERAATAERLSAHAGAGRLSVEELERRLERAHAAVVTSDLRALEADLPGPRPRPRDRLPGAVVVLAALALVATVAASVAVGHPVPPLLLVAAALLWRARRPWLRNGRGPLAGPSV